MRKLFEQALHDKYDAPAKEAVAAYVARRCGVTVQPNPDQYGFALHVVPDFDGFFVGIRHAIDRIKSSGFKKDMARLPRYHTHNPTDDPSQCGINEQ